MSEADERTLVEAALRELLEWDELKRSPQLGQFLRYIVEHDLDGQSEGIKAYAIAVDVFARPPDFDPQKDPIVRVQAARLRALLDRFYTRKLNRVPLRILVPIGRYVPKYLMLDWPAEAASEPASGVDGKDAGGQAGAQKYTLWQIPLWAKWALVLVAFFVVCTTSVWVTKTLVLRSDRQMLAEQLALERPVVRVSAFEDLTGVPGIGLALKGLAPQLTADLSRFEDLRVERSAPELPFAAEPPTVRSNRFRLSGTARREKDNISFDVLLTMADSPEIVWTHSVVFSDSETDYTHMMSDVARALSAVLGNHRGPLHAENLQKASLKLPQFATPSTYACLLLDTLARDEVSADHRRAARDCFAALRKADPNGAMALAGWAGNAAEIFRLDAALGDDLSDALYEATQVARRAVDLAPQSSFAYGQLARVMFAQHAIQQATIAHIQAIRRNPSDLDSLAEYAQFLAFTGSLEHGVEVMQLVSQQPVSAPPWYHIVPALQGLRRTNYEAALNSALIVSRGNPELGVVLALSAAPLAARSDVVLRFSDAALENKKFQEMGILPWVSKIIFDEEVLRLIEPGLLLSGLSHDVIWYPFDAPGAATQTQ